MTEQEKKESEERVNRLHQAYQSAIDQFGKAEAGKIALSMVITSWEQLRPKDSDEQTHVMKAVTQIDNEWRQLCERVPGLNPEAYTQWLQHTLPKFYDRLAEIRQSSVQ